MTPRTTGILLIAYSLLAAGQHALRMRVPVLKVPFLSLPAIGWLICAVFLFIGVWLALRGGSEWNLSPQTRKKLRRFREIRRGYLSFLILMGIMGLAAFDSVLVGKRALVVSYGGQWFFPFMTQVQPGRTFGLDSEAEADYRQLQEKFRSEKKGDWLVLPPVFFDPSLDSPAIIENVEQRDGKVFIAGEAEPLNGTAYSVFISKPDQKRQQWQFRHGVKHGEMTGFDLNGDLVEKARFEQGQQVEYKDFSDGKAATLQEQGHPQWRTLIYSPSPPSWQQGHYLGTNTTGIDLAAMLFGGLQMSLIAAVLYLIVTFGVGVAVGGALGFFGGVVDLVGQRIIEIWSVLPYLFVVMIISSLVTPTLTVLVAIVALFGWMETANYIRTATYKEKTRDYVAAARLLGASTPRILFQHILPNVISILVTLAPFKVAGVIIALAALDFLGFGLPPDMPSWGRLLHEGVDNFSAPWIVTSAFTAMATVLVLVTFIGEAVREAFDPKKFTTYE
jgi:microcin C transport system permease protein